MEQILYNISVNKKGVEIGGWSCCFIFVYSFINVYLPL